MNGVDGFSAAKPRDRVCINRPAESQCLAIVDFEFTGLNSEYITDNKIIQAKIRHLGTGKAALANYGSDKTLTAHVRLAHRVERYQGERFSAGAWAAICGSVGCDAETEYWGWGCEEDRVMLLKYGVDLLIKDIQEQLRLTDEFETKIALEGASLEAVYFLATGEIVNIDHASIGELDVIAKLHSVATALTPREHLTVMPWGFARGKPIKEYLVSNRRQADGYRHNNNDLLAKSLTAAVPPREYYGGFDDEDDFGDDSSLPPADEDFDEGAEEEEEKENDKS